MIVFGVGASTCAAGCEDFATSRLTEVTDTAVPAGTRTGAAWRCGPDWFVGLSGLFRSPFEAGAVGPDAMQDDGDLASHCNLGLFGADTLYQPKAPRFQCRPTLSTV